MRIKRQRAQALVSGSSVRQGKGVNIPFISTGVACVHNSLEESCEASIGVCKCCSQMNRNTQENEHFNVDFCIILLLLNILYFCIRRTNRDCRKQ